MLKNGQTAQTTITGYTSDGQGVCRMDGCAVFVPHAIAGETCIVRITKAGKNAAWGKIEQLLSRSAQRIPRACPYAKLCGGCQFQHMSYPEELSLKAQRVRDTLCRIGGEAVEEISVLSAPEINSYRNKGQYPVAMVNGKAAAGFYRERSHQLVPVERCLLLFEEADIAKDCVLRWMNKHQLCAYDEQAETGLVRHIYVRKAFATGQLLVCIVATERSLPHTSELLSYLKESLPLLTSVVLSVHRKPGNAVLGDEFVTLYGSGSIEDELCGLTFRLSPRSFYQVNRVQAERLYELAIREAQLTKAHTVLDLYCGTGTITLAMAQKAGRAIGVEVVEQAIADARENARRNHIENADFFCADAAQAVELLSKQGVSPDVVVVDPPRKGLAPAVIDALVQLHASRLVYISCDPATLARDIRLLKEQGYRFEHAQSVDLFPRCAHVETVCLLVRRNGLHINIDVDVEEMLQDKRGQATYPQIKEYVLKQTGMKVSSLYISQVKRKCGLNVSDSYNKPKSEDAHVPQCPPEKQKAIMDALRHFGLIS